MPMQDQVSPPLPLTADVESAWEVISISSTFIEDSHLVGQKAVGSFKRGLSKTPRPPLLTLSEVIYHVSKTRSTHRDTDRDTASSKTRAHRAELYSNCLYMLSPAARANHPFPREN